MKRSLTRSNTTLALLLFTSIIVGACNFPGSGATPDFEATSAAQTVAARLTQASMETVIEPPPLLTTEPPPEPPPVSSPTDTPIPTTAVPPTEVPTNTPTVTKTEIPCDRAAFITDVTIPDGEEIDPGDSFTKTWRLRNNGSCTWTSSYSLIFDHGDSMGGPAAVQLTSSTVEPGQSVDISVDLTAPNTPGTYKGFWMLRNGSGVVFGIGVNANVAFWVEIVVPEPATLDFTLTYRNIHQCGIHPFYATIRIKNTGDLDIESARIRIRDLTAAVDLYGPSTKNNWFLSNEGDCPPQDSRVEPGEVSFLAVNIGPAPGTGNNARVTLRLCSEDNLGGECLQKITTFVIP
jgi:hypothetical protein